MKNYYSMTKEEGLAEIGVKEQGLTSEEALLRLKKYGENILPDKKKKSKIGIFLEQFKNYLILILLIAAVIEIFMEKYTEAVAIMVVLLINATLGYTQEYKAQTSIDALRRISSPKAKVLRDGVRTQIETAKIVPGDIIFLETGDKVPADARLLETVNLQAQESSLTGESIQVEKTIEAMADDLQIGERRNMLFQGTIIVNGRGTAVVTATGIKTEIGNIAELIQSEGESTPLEKKLEQLSRHIGYTVAFVCIIVFITGFLRGEEIFRLFLTTVSLAVAAIPEGLPIVVTLTLAIGIQRMAKKNALIRRLPSVETLGSTTVICTDKTGTLTCDEMTVKKLYANREEIEVGGEGYSIEGGFSKDPKDFDILLKAGALCNDASIEGKIFGDPTEIALLVCAAKAGLVKGELERESPRTSEISFSSERKYMITIQGNTAYAKGAPDTLLNLCDNVLINGKLIKLSNEEKENILGANEKLAGEALRVLGFAYKQFSGDFSENSFIFLGLQGMIDPPRKEVKGEIQKCKDAGIKVIMITGDHPSTAAAIGKQLGLEVKILTGIEIDALKDLNSIVEDIIIFARVSPDHKLRIVEALKSQGHIVAMTGDGVNDAPALKKADIGIAMGITGTDVAREASDMILADDNFKSIVSAVEEGRGIYENIKKFLRFQLSTNVGAILTVFIGTLIGLPLPLTALQLLWINVIVDGPPALSLSVEPLDKESMKQPPRDPRERILSRKMLEYIITTGAMMAFGTLGIFAYMLSVDHQKAQTLAFTTFVFFQLFNVLNCRSHSHSIFRIGFFSNRISVLSIAGAILIQAAIIYLPQLQSVFGTVPLSIADWLFSAALASSIFIAFEIWKAFRNRNTSNPSRQNIQMQ
ncbi:Copper-exporting P-type ATPase B [uncultured archaeon]|nr:Copper-exporting P-type ATPase B [uncultured archaeon]